MRLKDDELTAEPSRAGMVAAIQACPVSKRLIFPPATEKTHRVRISPQVPLR